MFSAALRGVIGILFMGHGLQKLKGWFGGHGIEGTAGFFEMLGLRPGKRHATAAGLSETVGGGLLALGALTPLATTLLIGTMVTAIRKVHAPKGPWVTEGGYEYNLVLIAALTDLADHGPGSASVDAALFPRLKGPAWAALSLGAGIAGSYLVTERLTEPAPAPEAAPEAEPAATSAGRFAGEGDGTTQAAEQQPTQT